MTEPQRESVLHLVLLPRRDGYQLLSPELHERALRESDQATETPSDAGTFRRWSVEAASRYKKVTRRRRVREEILQDLVHPTTLEVRYPAALGREEARHAFRKLLADQVRKHRRWLFAGGALLPVGVLFTLIPGPNVLLAYLAWRSMAHYKSQAAGQIGLEKPAIVFHADPGLDPLLELAGKRFVLGRRRKIRELGRRLGVEGLDRA